MARRVYAPSPDQMSSAHIERAAKQARQTAMYADVSLKAEQLSLAKDDADEQAAAERMIRRLANRHACPGWCTSPEHERDLADARSALDALGLLDRNPNSPDETWLSTAQAARALGISETAVRKRTTKGTLRSAHIGRQRALRIDPDQVRRLAEAKKKEGSTP